MSDNRTNTDYYVTEDAHDEPTIWTGDVDDDDENYGHAIAQRCELDKLHPALWPIAVAVFTEPDEAVEAVAKAMWRAWSETSYLGWRDSDYDVWGELSDAYRYPYRRDARAALAAVRSLGGAS